MDLLSVALSLVAVLCVVFAFKRVAEGRTGEIELFVAGLGIAAGFVFSFRQSRIDYPLLDLSLFRQPRFAAALCAYGLTSFAMFGIYVLIGQYLQISRELSPLHAGLCTVPWAFAFVVGSLATPKLTRSMPAARVLSWGLAVGAVGFVMLVGVAGSQGLWWCVAAMIVMGLGLAPVFTLGNEVVVTAAPVERTGAASALSETSSELSGALGIAAFGSLATVLYRSSMSEVFDDGLPAAIREAAATLGGAVAAAGKLPAQEAGSLIRQANDAFVFSMQVASVAGACFVLLALLLCAWLLRKKNPLREPNT